MIGPTDRHISLKFKKYIYIYIKIYILRVLCHDVSLIFNLHRFTYVIHPIIRNL